MKLFKTALAYDRISSKEVNHLPIGTVLLVKSDNVKALKEHFIIISGPIIQKPHGMRPETIVVPAPETKNLVSQFVEKGGLIILKMKPCVTRRFQEVYKLSMNEQGKIEAPLLKPALFN